jgi:hypothetical protein
MGADDSHDLKPRNDQLGERAKTASRKAPLSEEPRPGADRKLSARKKLFASLPPVRTRQWVAPAGPYQSGLPLTEAI